MSKQNATIKKIKLSAIEKYEFSEKVNLNLQDCLEYTDWIKEINNAAKSANIDNWNDSDFNERKYHCYLEIKRLQRIEFEKQNQLHLKNKIENLKPTSNYFKSLKKLMSITREDKSNWNITRLLSFGMQIKKSIIDTNNMDSKYLLNFYSCLGGTGKSTLIKALSKIDNSIKARLTDLQSLAGKFNNEVAMFNNLCLIEELRSVKDFGLIDKTKINEIIDQSEYFIEKKGIDRFAGKSITNIVVGSNQEFKDDRRFSTIYVSDNKYEKQDRYGNYSFTELVDAWKIFIEESPTDLYFEINEENESKETDQDFDDMVMNDILTEKDGDKINFRTFQRAFIGEGVKDKRELHKLQERIKNLIEDGVLTPLDTNSLVKQNFKVDMKKMKNYKEEDTKTCLKEETLIRLLKEIFTDFNGFYDDPIKSNDTSTNNNNDKSSNEKQVSKNSVNDTTENKTSKIPYGILAVKNFGKNGIDDFTTLQSATDEYEYETINPIFLKQAYTKDGKESKTPRTQSNVANMNRFLFEIDPPENLTKEEIETIKKETITMAINSKIVYRITDSGNKSVHCIVKSKKLIETCEEYKYWWNFLNNTFFEGKADKACNDPVRLTRRPGAINQKTKNKQELVFEDKTILVELNHTDYEEDIKYKKYAEEIIKERFTRQLHNYTDTDWHNAVNEAAKSFIDGSIEDGRKHGLVWTAAASMKAHNWTEYEVKLVFDKYPKNNYDLTKCALKLFR